MVFRRRDEAPQPQPPDPTLVLAEGLMEIAGATGARDVCDIAQGALTTLLACDRIGLLRMTHDLLVPIASGEPQPLLEAEVGCAAAALQTRQARWVTQEGANLDESETPQPTTALAIPLQTGGDRIGVAVASWYSRTEPPTEAVLAAARALCAAASLALARSDLATRVAYLSEADELTGAHSQRSLVALLEALRAQGTPHALVLVDVDGFADLNASLGQERGDRLLAGLAGLMQQECRSGDIVARAEADAFALVLPGSSVHAAEAAARRLVAAVADWGHEDHVTASAGVAGAIADARADVLELAQSALLRARADGQGGVSVA